MICFFYLKYSQNLIATCLIINSVISIVKPLIKSKKSKTITITATKQKENCLIKKIKK